VIWEYLVIYLKTADYRYSQEVLNEQGVEKWELVAVTFDGEFATAYLKRPKHETNTRDLEADSLRLPFVTTTYLAPT
jgi:hypothetical protein